MNKQSIHVVARVVAIPNKVEELKSLLLGLIEPTRQETGVIKYELLQNQCDPTEFIFVEEWESAEALNTHLASPHVQAALASSEGLIAAPLDVRSGFSPVAIASEPDGSVTIKGSQFNQITQNKGVSGRAVYKPLGGLTIEESIFQSNSSVDEGGGVYVDGANPKGPSGDSNTANDGKGIAQQVVFQLEDGGGNVEYSGTGTSKDARVTANSVIADPDFGKLQSFGLIREYARPLGTRATTGARMDNISGVTSGNDTLVGNSKDNRLIGSLGEDTVTGGAGRDRFVYTDIRHGNDLITDFEVGIDRIALIQSLWKFGYTDRRAIEDGYVKVVQGSSESNYNVQIDPDGSAGSDVFRSYLSVNVTRTDSLNNPVNFLF